MSGLMGFWGGFEFWSWLSRFVMLKGVVLEEGVCSHCYVCGDCGLEFGASEKMSGSYNRRCGTVG